MSLALPTSAEENRFVYAEQIRAFLRETNDQNFAGALVMSLIAYVCSSTVPTLTWAPALAVLWAITLYRAWCIRQYERQPEHRSIEHWGKVHTIAGTLAGACWGIANTMMLPLVSTEYQLFILTVVAVSAAASGSEGFSFPLPSRGFILTALLPPTAWLFTQDDRIHIVLGLMLAIFVPMTLLQTSKRNRVFNEAQQLRYQNEQLARELSRQCVVAEQASLAKGRFLAAASHDLRQPMQALNIFHELLEREHQESGTPSQNLRNAQKAARAMNSLLDALLDISRLDAKVIRPQLQTFPLQKLFDEISRDFSPIAEKKGLRLRVRPSRLHVTSDRTLLMQVLRNFVANAIRYTERGSILLSSRRRGDSAVLAVLDTGIGIAPDHREAIFGEFYQVDNKARDRQQGIGLGLAIVERIARLMAYPLDVRSRPGKGSRFSIAIPLGEALPLPPLPEHEEPALPDSLLGRTVLVVEDEHDIREAVSELLRGWGCTVSAAATAEEALVMLGAGESHIDAVISDMNLPGHLSGIALIELLRQRSPTPLATLLVTGDTSQATLQAARAANLITLHKPVRPARLRAALAAQLSLRDAPPPP